MNILVNLPSGFFAHPALAPAFQRLSQFGTARQTSHNTGEEIRTDLAWANAIFMWSWPVLTSELLEAAPDLSYLGCIDISQRGASAALNRHLPTSVSRGGFSPAVAEMALGLILTTLRKISDFHAQMRTGTEKWVQDFPTEIDPQERELTGLRVGIVGLGQVGRRLAELLQPFRCDLRVYDPFISEERVSAYGGVKSELAEMIQASDVVVLCAASNSGTSHLLGREEIALFRKDAVLVNVARAALIDTTALTERLRRGDLFAALDVFDQEPLEKDSPLRSLPNVYLTPHRAGGVLASVQRTLDWLMDDWEALQAGRERRYALTEAMLPSLDD